jgi:hypothetical protein
VNPAIGSLYDYMMTDVSHGDICIHENGIAIMDCAWPVCVFQKPATDPPVHTLEDGACWEEHIATMVRDGYYTPARAEHLRDGLLVAWAIACG